MTKALVVEPDGSARVVETETDLESLRSLIGGGWLEGVAGKYGEWTAYGDEEGKLRGLPFNRQATTLVRRIGGYSDLLVGTVVFFGLEMEDPEEGYVETDVPESIVEAWDPTALG